MAPPALLRQRLSGDRPQRLVAKNLKVGHKAALLWGQVVQRWRQVATDGLDDDFLHRPLCHGGHVLEALIDVLGQLNVDALHCWRILCAWSIPLCTHYPARGPAYGNELAMAYPPSSYLLSYL